MKNNKGFTVIELLVSFSLTMLVMGFLFEVVISLKNLYNKTGIETELFNKQGLISKIINEDFINKKINKIEPCENTINCFNIEYYDENTNDTTTKTLSIESEQTIKYGDSVIKIDDNSKFGDITFKVMGDNKLIYTFATDEKTVMSLSIPITNTILDKDFDIIAVYQNSI